MEFQVVTDKLLPDIEAGLTRIVFSYRKDMAALDLVRYPQSGAGLDNIATVLSELAERLLPEKLASLSGAFEKAVVQRLGHLLGRLGHPRPPVSGRLSPRGN